MKILIADDAESMRLIIRKVLLGLGYSDVHEAFDGLDTIEKLDKAAIAKKPYDLIICDWIMPSPTGIEILERCRKSGSYTKTPFIIITAEGDSENILRAVHLGATSYIAKPVSSTELKEKLQKIFKDSAKQA